VSSFDPLGVRANDPLEKWRQDAEEWERKCALAREEMKREEQRALHAKVSNEAWSALEQRLAAIEQSHSELQANVVEAWRATGDAISALTDHRVELSRDQKDEIRELKIEVAKLATLAAELREQKATFQFAREREKTGEQDQSDLPSFLPRRELN
jgi:hypothetical protein